MKRTLVLMSLCFFTCKLKAQTTISGDYKVIDIGNNGVGDYTKSLILLHEMFDSNLINHNFAIGTITAMRGHSASGLRLNSAMISSASAYNGTLAMITSHDDYSGSAWKLKTCIYQNKKYLAIDIPYSPAYHDKGFKFFGATKSTGENMKCVSYEVNGAPYNQNLISNIEDFNSNMLETHTVQNLSITGNVGIGLSNPTEKLSVNGKIRAKEIRVENANWPDFVFAKSYSLPTLKETEAHIKEKGHLPGIPSAAEVKDNGVDLGEMNAKLLQKIEELTLYLIEQNKEIKALANQNLKLKSQVERLETKF